ncbi:MAG: FHA domain-containing protein [Bacillota bacterium]|nr:FHA domain-containing protein [Bacillota bacterium]
MRCSAAPYEGKNNYIFASYCHEDEDRVYPCIEMMARDGCRIWFDEGIIPGDEWRETIAEHLAGCEVFVAFITENSMTSHNCRSEINFAVQKNKEIITLFLDDVKLSPGMEMVLSNVQGIYRSRYASVQEFISRAYENERIQGCRGEFRPEIIPGLFEETESTLTLTIGIAQNEYSRKQSFLYRVGTGDKIYITKDIFSLGRSKSQSDYTLEGSKTVSRKHATLRRINGRYTITDNESLNHTILNGQILAPWIENDLKDGDTVSLGKELFLFFEDYDESNIRKMPEHVLITDAGEINVPDQPVTVIDDFVILNSGKAYYLINSQMDKDVWYNGERLFYGEKRRLQNEDNIISGSSRYTWKLSL